MPTCFLICEGCGARQATFLEDAEVAQMQHGRTHQKHCLTCRTTTDWVLDRRSGSDRRGRGPREGNSPRGE